MLPVDVVSLNGSNSTDDKKIVSYSWTLEKYGSTYFLSNPIETHIFGFHFDHVNLLRADFIASVHDFIASVHDFIASVHDFIASVHDFIASVHDFIASVHDFIASVHDFIASVHDFIASVHDFIS